MIHVVNLSSLTLLGSYYSSDQAVNRAGDDPELDLCEGRRSHVKHVLATAKAESWSPERVRAELSRQPGEPATEAEAEGEAVTVQPDMPPVTEQPEFATEPEGPPDGEHP